MQSATSFKSRVPHSPTSLVCPSAIPSTLVSLLATWSSRSPSEVHVSPLVGGLTNTIYKVTLPHAVPASVLVRIFGVPELIPPLQRVFESIVFEKLSDAHIAPRLLATLPNGRVEQYLEARNIRLHEMTHPDVLKGVAQSMARMHKFHPHSVDIRKELALWSDMGKWIEEIVQMVGKGKLKMPTGVPLERCRIGLEQLKQELEGSGCPVVFCHNDLWSGNIMISEDDATVSFVDFEFSAFNYRGFDIGNFFSEAAWGKVGGELHDVGYPSISQRRFFCDEYLRCFHSHEETRMGTADVDALMEEAERFGRAAHLYWGLWALKLSVESTVNYPYVDFAQHRLWQFLKGR